MLFRGTIDRTAPSLSSSIYIYMHQYYCHQQIKEKHKMGTGMWNLLPTATLWLCCYAVVLAVTLVWLMRGMSKLSRHSQWKLAAEIPPGSQGLPLIGETLHFLAATYSSKGFYDFVHIRLLRYGNCFRTSIFGETHVFVSSTESAKVVLNNEVGKFTKRYIKSIAELVGDDSLLCASHQQHKLIRGRLITLFSTASISSFIKQFDQLIVTTLSGWQHKATVVVLDEALELICKAMCKMLMSLESGNQVEMLQKDVAHVCEAMLAFPLRLPGTRFYKGLEARKRVMKMLERKIEERRRGEAYHEDFLQHLLKDNGNGCSDEVPSLTDAEIKDNILTMIIAGQDTTASAITWMVKYLDDNQHALHTLRAEQGRIAEKTCRSSPLTLDDLNEMPYASKVVKESLRMASTVAWLPRVALQDCVVQGFKIKKGWNINIDARSIHLDPTLYDNPTNFNPSRFNGEAKPYSFLAFGAGGRTCLGINMAKAMMLVFLHRLITTYEWRVVNPDSSIEKWALFSRLKSGCPIHVRPITKDAPEA